jgi:hypothetical protein
MSSKEEKKTTMVVNPSPFPTKPTIACNKLMDWRDLNTSPCRRYFYRYSLILIQNVQHEKQKPTNG